MRTALAPHVINWWSKKIPMTPGCQQSILWHQYKSILDKSKHKIFYCSLVVGWDCWVTCRLCRGGDPWSSKAWCVKSVVISSLVIRTTTQFKWSRDRSEIGLVTSDSCFDDGHSLVNNILHSHSILHKSRSHGTTRWIFFGTSYSSRRWVLLGQFNLPVRLYD